MHYRTFVFSSEWSFWWFLFFFLKINLLFFSANNFLFEISNSIFRLSQGSFKRCRVLLVVEWIITCKWVILGILIIYNWLIYDEVSISFIYIMSTIIWYKCFSFITCFFFLFLFFVFYLFILFFFFVFLFFLNRLLFLNKLIVWLWTFIVFQISPIQMNL